MLSSYFVFTYQILDPLKFVVFCRTCSPYYPNSDCIITHSYGRDTTVLQPLVNHMSFDATKPSSSNFLYFQLEIKIEPIDLGVDILIIFSIRP